MGRIAEKTYKELCEAMLGKNSYKVAELTAHKLYRIEDTDELKAYGLDEHEATVFLSGIELGRRAFLKTEEENKHRCSNPKELGAYIVPKLRYLNHEEFWVIAVNNRSEVIDATAITKGILTECYAHPREIFKFAIMKNAAAIFVAHNHTSGETIPSLKDQKLTKRLIRAGRLIGIPLFDHIIVGDGTFYSLMAEKQF